MPNVDLGMNKLPPAKSKKKRKKMQGGPDEPAYSDSNHPDDEDAPPEEDEESKGSKPKDKDDDESDEDILKRILKRFKRCVSYEGENRKQALEDLKFKAGDQWPADVAAQRNTDKRPCLTVNKIPTFIHQVTNAQRENRPSINVNPVGDKSDPDAAKMYRGLIRAIERDSAADIAYDTAFENAVSNGFGYFRITTDWEHPKSFNQVIRIVRIRNPFTVYLDPDHQEPDGADCEFGFVTELVTRDEFKDQWPDADPMPFNDMGVGEIYKDWINSDTLRIAEYFEVKHRKRKLVELENGYVGFEDSLSDEVKKNISSKRVLVRRERETDEPYIKWYKVTAKEILQSQKWLGRWIPIIPVIGNEIDIEGKLKLSGLIRDAKDSQRIYNYSVTAETELVALAPKAPFVMEEGQLEGHETEWKQANTKNFAVLSYKGTSVNGVAAPPPQRQPMVGTPVGWVQMKMGAAQDMMATTGVRFDPTNSENRVDDSGRAIRELRRSSDIGSFHYVDNLARSLKRCGQLLIDLIPKIYDERQVITILREDDSEERIQIDPGAPKAFNEVMNNAGKKMKIFNPNAGRYGVTVTIGPSYATKRIEASESMMQFAKAMPAEAQKFADLIAKNMDWPGAQEIASRLAKAIPANLLTPDQKDVPPQMQALMQAMQQQIQQLTQQLQGAMAALNDKDKDRAVALEKIQKDYEAKMAAILEKAEANFQKHVGSHVQNLADDVRNLTDHLHKMNGATPSNQNTVETGT